MGDDGDEGKFYGVLWRGSMKKGWIINEIEGC
jgi:hypothetical protein